MSGATGMRRWRKGRARVQVGPAFPGLLAGAVLLGLLAGSLRADIVSSGNIFLDANADGAAEVALTASGLGIGTTSPSTNLHVLGNAYITVNVGVGTASPKSTLEVSGTMGMTPQSISTNTALSGNSIVLADTSGGNLLVSLPAASSYAGRTYRIKKMSSSNKLWVTGGGNIDGSSMLTLTTVTAGFPSLEVVSNGSQWYILSISGSNTNDSGNGLLGWWRLDDASSSATAADSSGLGYDGTLKSGAAFAGNVGVIAGALGLDYSYHRHFSHSANVNTSKGTIAHWAKPRDLSSLPHLIFYQSSGNGNNNYNGFGDPTNMIEMHTGTYTTSKWCFFLQNGSSSNSNTVTLLSTTTPVAGRWDHMVTTWDLSSNAIKLYVNGALETTGSLANINGSYTPSYRVVGENGANFTTGANRGWDGELDDVRLYDHALTAEEIGVLYSSR